MIEEKTKKQKTFLSTLNFSRAFKPGSLVHMGGQGALLVRAAAKAASPAPAPPPIAPPTL